MKPRIKLRSRYGFQQKVWRCVGPNMYGVETAGHGKTPEAAFEDWKRSYDFPF